MCGELHDLRSPASPIDHFDDAVAWSRDGKLEDQSEVYSCDEGKSMVAALRYTCIHRPTQEISDDYCLHIFSGKREEFIERFIKFLCIASEWRREIYIVLLSKDQFS